MKYLLQICLIFLFSFLGEVLHSVIPFPIPASIYAMVLLFAALALRIVPLKAVKEAGGFFTSILPVLFVAPMVNLMDCWDLVRDNLLPIGVIMVVTTVLVFAVSGLVTQWLTGKKEDNQDA